MSMDQIMDWVWIVFLIIVAGSYGVSTGLDFYIKKIAADGKKVPTQVVTAKEAADALYSEANKILDVTGAQKKAWATEQLQKQKPNLTKEVAAGLIQKSYDDAHANDPKDDTSNSEDTTQPIGFLDNGGDSNGSSQV